MYLGPFIGARGVHLKSLCNKHGIDNVHFGGKDGQEEPTRRCRVFIRTSPFTVSYEYAPEDSVKTKGFRQALDDWAGKVKEKREKHTLAVSTTYIYVISIYYS